MSTEIYYFSGTGNSLHVARELQERLPGTTLIPIVSLLHKQNIQTKAPIVGFVFPLYFTTVPAPVRHFCNEVSLNSAQYIFSVVTRLGTFSVADLNIERILRKKGKLLNAEFILNMAQNSPTGLAPGKGDAQWTKKISSEKVFQMEQNVQKQLETIQKQIVSQSQNYSKKSFRPAGRLTERVMHALTANIKAEVGYYSDDTCIHCGTCAHVCPASKINLHDGKPVWNNDVQCFYCFACFNFCPAQAILVKNKYTQKDGRYHHPAISADDIACQKTAPTITPRHP